MRETLLVGTGAALGALARHALTVALTDAGLLPLWPLLLINVLGATLMGFFRPGPFWGTGVLGGFTSFATFALLSSQLPALQAGAYVAATGGGCLGAYLLGARFCRKVAP